MGDGWGPGNVGRLPVVCIILFATSTIGALSTVARNMAETTASVTLAIVSRITAARLGALARNVPALAAAVAL